MIIEGLMTTVCDDGAVNLSPMGPLVDPSLTRFHLRPYQSSRTFKNLVSRGEAVFHVTDDVGLIARAAVGQVEPFPEVKRSQYVCNGFQRGIQKRLRFHWTRPS